MHNCHPNLPRINLYSYSFISFLLSSFLFCLIKFLKPLPRPYRESFDSLLYTQIIVPTCPYKPAIR